ncbi:site-specific integrase [Klebsiella aerogenes]|uniref:site-specific integrase n=1 Tax=Klebsiella aerogenes TaxID=548 RepID=UPI002A83793C|nr:site-specific integrase [Klebsiella aerogenes]WPS00480.1 site-specific integrase [Klebsiella aerogenes]WPS39809.1 site-specific integrase [Klebsiella aerogenes]
MKYPTGVENHGGSLRLWFIYKGVRVRENLGIPDTPKNRRMAGELRTTICYAIKTGTFNYVEQFPQSSNLGRFGLTRPGITVGELAKRWLELKRMEITLNAFNRYRSYIKICCELLGPDKMLTSINTEQILLVRKELLTGFQICGIHQQNRSAKKGRTVRTVNVYLNCLGGMFSFAKQNGYIDRNPFEGIDPLRKSRSEPDPLTHEEYFRLLNACPSEQIKNLWILAVNTGLRHGEISALAWEDIDLKKWTITVSRNIAIKGHFTPPKTECGNREIVLTDAAIQALKSQMVYTRMGKQHQIKVHLREFGRTRTDACTFVFVPRLTARNGKGGDWYAPGSFGATWNDVLKRAGIRHRRAYESRHTFACWALSAGANPNFIASQMGHTSAQMVYNVYGKWMTDNNSNQMAILNANFGGFAPSMPQALNQ